MGDRWALLLSFVEKRKKLKQFLSRFFIHLTGGRDQGQNVTLVTSFSHDVIISISHPRCVCVGVFTMSVFDKFKKGAVKAGIQATTLFKEGSTRVQSSSQSFAQGFSLPGEAEKAAKILATFLGSSSQPSNLHEVVLNYFPQANPEDPQSALNAIPKAVLQRARGVHFSPLNIFLSSPADATHSLLPNEHRPRRLPGPQSRLRFLRESRLWPRHSALTRWLMVCPILYRDRWCWLGSADWRGHHRFCRCPQQRRCGSRIFSRWERHHCRQRQRCCRSHRHWRERSGEPCTSSANVFILQV
jgi:hypothetical protein